jgi:hypothetical protein
MSNRTRFIFGSSARAADTEPAASQKAEEKGKLGTPAPTTPRHGISDMSNSPRPKTPAIASDRLVDSDPASKYKDPNRLNISGLKKRVAKAKEANTTGNENDSSAAHATPKHSNPPSFMFTPSSTVIAPSPQHTYAIPGGFRRPDLPASQAGFLPPQPPHPLQHSGGGPRDQVVESQEHEVDGFSSPLPLIRKKSRGETASHAQAHRHAGSVEPPTSQENPFQFSVHQSADASAQRDVYMRDHLVPLNHTQHDRAHFRPDTPAIAPHHASAGMDANLKRGGVEGDEYYGYDRQSKRPRTSLPPVYEEVGLFLERRDIAHDRVSIGSSASFTRLSRLCLSASSPGSSTS